MSFSPRMTSCPLIKSMILGLNTFMGCNRASRAIARNLGLVIYFDYILVDLPMEVTGQAAMDAPLAVVDAHPPAIMVEDHPFKAGFERLLLEAGESS